MKKVLLVCMEWQGGMKHYFETIYNVLLCNAKINVYGFILMDPRVNSYQEKKELMKKYNGKLEVVFRQQNKIKRVKEKIYTNKIDNQLFKYAELKQCDIIHVLWDNSFVNNITKLSKKFNVLYTIHDFQNHEKRYKNLSIFLMDKLDDKRRKIKREKSTYLVTNSIYQKELINRKYNKKQVLQFNMPTSITERIKKGKYVPSEVKNANDYILFFGRIEKYKGLEYLVDTYMSSHKIKNNYKLVIAGSGNIYFDINLEDKNIIWLNRYILDSEIAELLRRAKIVVFPYISATQAGPPSIAHFFNVPIVASDVDGLREFITDGITGILTDPTDKIKFEEDMLKLLNQEEIYNKISYNQKIYYNNYYSKQGLKKSLIDIYNSID